MTRSAASELAWGNESNEATGSTKHQDQINCARETKRRLGLITIAHYDYFFSNKRRPLQSIYAQLHARQTVLFTLQKVPQLSLQVWWWWWWWWLKENHWNSTVSIHLGPGESHKSSGAFIIALFPGHCGHPTKMASTATCSNANILTSFCSNRQFSIFGIFKVLGNTTHFAVQL